MKNTKLIRSLSVAVGLLAFGSTSVLADSVQDEKSTNVVATEVVDTKEQAEVKKEAPVTPEVKEEKTEVAAPAEVKPEEAAPAEVNPAEVKPEEAAPAEVNPAEVKPEEAAPAEAKPAEVKPEEAAPAEVNPAEVKPEEVAPAEVNPAEVKPEKVTPKEVTDLSQQKNDVIATADSWLNDGMISQADYDAFVATITNATTQEEIDALYLDFYDNTIVPPVTAVEEIIKGYEDEVASWVTSGQISADVELYILSLIGGVSSLKELEQLMADLRVSLPELQQAYDYQMTIEEWYYSGLITQEQANQLIAAINNAATQAEMDEIFTNFYDTVIVPPVTVIEEIIKGYEDEIASWVTSGHITAEQELAYLLKLNGAESLEEMAKIMAELRAGINTDIVEPKPKPEPKDPKTPINLDNPKTPDKNKPKQVSLKTNSDNKNTSLLPATGEKENMLAAVVGTIMLGLFVTVYFKKETEFER